MSRTRRLTTMLAAAGALIAFLALPGTAAAAKDRNHDRIPDRWEKRHRLSLSVNQSKRDQDRDRLRNLAEFEAETNPRDPNTDNDGVPDGQEHAGTIESFDAQSGMLTIDLFGKGTISGLITEATEIECDDSGGQASASDSSDGGEGSDDDRQGEEVGDDDGQGNDAQENGSGGDDAQGSNCTVADLTPGATVHEAELKVAGGSAVFEKVELAG